MTYEVHLMVGIPAAGKSTFIEQEMERLEADGYTCAHISRDKVRFSMLNKNDEYFDREKEVFEEFVRQINESIEVGINVVFVDATHISPASRGKILRRIKSDTYTTLILDVFSISLDVALSRNDKREGRAKVPESAMKNMFNNFIPPAYNEIAKQGYYGFGGGVKIIEHILGR